MTWPALLVSALVSAALLVVAPATAPGVANAPSEAVVHISFESAANHGLHAKVEASRDKARLIIERKGRYVSYEVRAEVTEAGLKAQFGKLGLIDVAFTPTETVVDGEPPERCEGEPSTVSKGAFSGTMEFNGEHDYVRIEEHRIKGRIWVRQESTWRCPGRERSMRDSDGADGVFILSSGGKLQADQEPATLGAVRRGCRCRFIAYSARDRGASGFIGSKSENREGMEISRAIFAHAGAAAFDYDHVAGTAVVNPPPPFSGRATFKRRPDRRELWRSTLRIPLLGADALSFPGGRSRAGLIPEFPFS